MNSWAGRGFYVLALALVLFPLQELFVTVWPFQLGELMWRHAALGLAANFLYRTMGGLALAIVLAYWLEHRTVLRVAGVAALLLAGLVLPMMAFFALDLPVVAELRGEDGRNTLIAGAFQEFKYLLTLLGAGLLGWGALEMSRRADVEGAKRTRGAPSTLRPSAG